MKSNRQINKEAQAVDGEDTSPAVVAYRLGQLESTVKEGFKSHNERLTELTGSFAAKADVVELSRRLQSLVTNVATLNATDNRQQGAIDANRRFISIVLTVVGIMVAAITTYLGIVHAVK